MGYMKHFEDPLNNQSSMLFWWPKVKDLKVPMPETRILELTINEAISGEDFFSREVHEKAVSWVLEQKLGWPLFLRTDLASGKHEWKDTCYVKGPYELSTNLQNLITVNRSLDILGLPFKAVVPREFIPLDSKFCAFFGEMPIGPEIRVFVRNGSVACIHNYWPKDSVEMNKDDDWEEKWENIDDIVLGAGEEVSKMAETIGAVLPEYWSVDFALGKNKKWYFIDAARGEISYHDSHEEGGD